MSALEETRAETFPVGEVSEPILRRAPAVRLSPGLLLGLATAGRFAVVWLPVYALLLHHDQPLAADAAKAGLISLIWLVSLRLSVGSARLTMPARGIALALAVGSMVGLVLVSGLSFWIPGLEVSQLDLLEMTGAIFLLGLGWEHLVRSTAAAERRILVVGASDGGSELIEELALLEDSPYHVIGVVDDERETSTVAGAPLLGRTADLPALIEREQPDLVVLAVSQNRLETFARLLSVATHGFRVAELPQFYEQAFGRVPVRRLTSAWFMSVLHLYQRPYTRIAKRSFDILVASIGLLVTAPLFPILALLVKTTAGPLVFRQVRLGEGGRLFTILKFRTMRNGAEEPGRPLWAEERDPRVTSIGRLMRRTRLDELPQLVNVLRGEMSIVGPRPERPEFVELLEDTVPFWNRRHLVKPGITGWAQVSCGYSADAEGTVEKLSYDLWYLRHRSLAVDLGICAKTLRALVTGAGAR
ncbi:MAG: sugar transferase [Gaiellaceae bacterium]